MCAASLGLRRAPPVVGEFGGVSVDHGLSHQCVDSGVVWLVVELQAVDVAHDLEVFAWTSPDETLHLVWLAELTLQIADL